MLSTSLVVFSPTVATRYLALLGIGHGAWGIGTPMLEYLRSLIRNIFK
ncbi:hypothetical protein [Nostoc sp.]